MSADEMSLHDLRLLAAGSTPALIGLDWLTARTHEVRLSCVRRAIDWIAMQFARDAKHKQEDTEDALTVQVIGNLKSMGFQASHDTECGGHCDILVEGRDDFIWIAEAKIHSDYDWLLKGFNQLDTRYSVGLTGQDNGELIIYLRSPNARRTMERWIERLNEKRPDVQTTLCPKGSLCHFSNHTHAKTGLPFTTRHTPFCMHFDPRD